MKSEPLNINDKTFLINRLIQQAPVSTLVREFFKNSEENALLAPSGSRRIEIYPVVIDGVRKLAFWNTGLGMDAEELRRATDLSSSINKEMALDGNYGIGAKVSGLTMSKEGIRYRSCKSGRVHEVTIGYDNDLRTYARFAVQFSDGRSETVYDVTTLSEKEGRPTDYDWTEVVLYGESADHDTVSEPLGKGRETDRSYIPTTIFRRFAEFGDGVEVRIDVAMTKGGGKDETGRFRQLKPLNDVLDRLPNHQFVVDDETGIRIHYIHDPKHENSSHTLSSRANPATASTTFCALVHKGERYDFKTKKGWSSVAPNFGIPFGSRVLSVEIYIPSNMAMPNQYRDGLTYPEDRSAMLSEHFAEKVRELMPEWVKEVIRSESPEAGDNLDDLQKDLQKLLDEFRVPTIAISYPRRATAETAEDSDEGTDITEPTIIPNEEDSEVLGDREDAGPEVEPAVRRANKKKVRKAPEGAQPSQVSKALERVPEIKILTDEVEINEKSLKGRAGRYYKDAQMLFINGLYPAVERMSRDLEREMAGSDDPELTRRIVLDTARRFMAFRVGKATCFAISKRLSDDWSMDDLDKATTPESLSMAADDYKQSLPAAKKWVKGQLKSNQMVDLAGA